MTSKEKILEAAVALFASKGKHGPTMEEIAARARINKAMVYYYFSNRDNLFRQALVYIFTQIFKQVVGPLALPQAARQNAVELLEKTIRRHFRLISQNPTWARLVFSSLVNEEEDLLWAIEEVRKKAPRLSPLALLALIEKGIAENELRPVDPAQAAVSIAGINLVYLLSRPIARVLLGLDSKAEEAFLQAREESVIDLIFYGLRCRDKDKKRRKRLGLDQNKPTFQKPMVRLNSKRPKG